MRAAILLLFALAACKPANLSPADNVSSRGAVSLPDKIATAPVGGAAPADLTGYVGKYPDDKVDGVAFRELPAVKAAVAAAVPDRAIAATVLAFDGPNTPIVAKDGRLFAHGCETHNCGAHNWTIALARDGTSANVCYQPDGAAPHWYGATPPATTDDSCPSGDE